MNLYVVRAYPFAVRYVFGAAIFLTGWSIVLLTPVMDDGLAFVVAATACIAAGLVARGWAILPLVLAIVPLAAAQPCNSAVNECDVNAPVLALMWFVPLATALLGIGIGVAKLARCWHALGPDHQTNGQVRGNRAKRAKTPHGSSELGAG